MRPRLSLNLEKTKDVIEILPSSDSRILGFKLSGRLHDSDYKKFVPLIDQTLEKQAKLCLLVHFHDFHGWDAQAMWDDTKFAATHCAKIERVAMVGDQLWEKWMAN